MQGIFVPPVGSSTEQMATPALMIDMQILQKNIVKLFSEYKKLGVSVRPHVKTAKTPVIAKMLLNAGAKGVCVAKVGEAQIMSAAGISDILITSPIGHQTTASWLATLAARHANLKVVVDSLAGATILSEALKKADVDSIKVLIDVNVGQYRTGVLPGAEAMNLAQALAKLGNLQLIGCQGYEGHLQQMSDLKQKREQILIAMKDLTVTADMLRDAGFDIQIVTTGGTGSGRICAEVPGITEVQPGSFIFMDNSYREALGEDGYGISLSLLATVISKPDSRTATIDAGWKSLSVDCGPAVPLDRRWSYQPAGDEHGLLKGQGVEELKIGDRVTLLPSHCDTTITLHELFYVMDDHKLAAIWPIETRGRVQ